MNDYLLYTREDSGRELPGSGALLLPGKALKASAFGEGMAEVLVQRGDCVYCDADGEPASEAKPASVSATPIPEPAPEPKPETFPEVKAEPAPPAMPAETAPEGQPHE